MMNVIRCDEPSYLVWKWYPQGEADSSRQNSIRWGSSLRVKDGEIAIFVYNNRESGACQDVIRGPFDQILQTSNLPVLSSIIGLAYDRGTPFQAEIYFINQASNIQLLFGVPFFNAFDSRYPDLPVPIAVHGTMTFYIENYQDFIRCNRLVHFELDDLKHQIKMIVNKYTKSEILRIVKETNTPLIQIETHIVEISDAIESSIKDRVEAFGIKMRNFDIDDIVFRESDPSFINLKALTIDIKADSVLTQARLANENLSAMQGINQANVAATMRIQREEAQRAQSLKTETDFIGAHTINQQTSVLRSAAENLGQMGNVGGGGGSFNPAGVMTNMMVGGALGGQMAGIMNQTMNNMSHQATQQRMMTPPAVPLVSYYVYLNGQQIGPLSIDVLQQMANTQQLTPDTYVWKQGMSQWDFAKNTELLQLFLQNQMPPSMPPIPPTV